MCINVCENNTFLFYCFNLLTCGLPCVLNFLDLPLGLGKKREILFFLLFPTVYLNVQLYSCMVMTQVNFRLSIPCMNNTAVVKFVSLHTV